MDELFIIMKKALVLGGYGNFGKRICEALLKTSIPVTIAGRNISKARNVQSELARKYDQKLISTAQVQVSEKISQSSAIIKDHGLVINTCGPFQTANYQVVEECIKQKTHYIDLADGRNFVVGMNKLNQKAKQAGVCVIAGASSVPGLSSAIIEEYKSELSQIDSVAYGISPGQRTTRGGLATVKGVLSYIGKPIKPFAGVTKPVYGWQDLYRENYPELGYRFMANCEVPDLDILPKRYSIKKIRFSAGMESSILHLAIYATSWLIRYGFPIDLPKYANFLMKFSHWGFDWMGTDAGGLHMTIEGKDLKGTPYRRKWFIIVKDGDGPNVPTVPAIVLARKICQGVNIEPGVHPCVGLVSLKEYLDEMKQYSMKTYTYKY